MTNTTDPTDLLRDAALRRLCVNLRYNGTWRLVEPYGLCRTQEGHLLLHARKVDDERRRTYRVDRIQEAQPTDIHFHPLYAVEMTQGGPLFP